jgi:hypothetical protein
MYNSDDCKRVLFEIIFRFSIGISNIPNVYPINIWYQFFKMSGGAFFTCANQNQYKQNYYLL